MASSALEEKINKIRLQNEEIRRRHEEVEADKKNAAKLNALVQMVPSDDWPERKEPPEFSAPPKTPKQKISNKEHDRAPQHYSGIQERLGKKDHKFAQGDGPPPDPKYNFLADSEREMRLTDDGKVDDDKNKSRNKTPRGAPKRRGGGGGGSRDAYFKDNRGPHAFHSKEEALPEYEAWRAERNRIDEARINRQKTAEGNWRREWDSNKINIEKDSSRKGDTNRKDSNTYERRNNYYNSDHSTRGHGGSRTYHGSQKNHGHQDYRRPYHDQPHEYKKQVDNKPTEDRTVTATEKSIKVTVNHGNQSKGPMMSVKVNSPSIVGTGRVGPRQKNRLTYSSQSDADGNTHEVTNFSRQKSFDEKTSGGNFNGGQKITPKSPFSQRKKENNSKSPYPQRKEYKSDESSARSKNTTKTLYIQKNESKDQRPPNNSTSKSQRPQKRIQKSVTDRAENLSSFDDAIPSEYNPDNSFNYGEINEQKDRNENDNCENISDEIIEKIEKDISILKTSDDGAINECINEQNTDNMMENISNENKSDGQDEDNENNKHIETDDYMVTAETNNVENNISNSIDDSCEKNKEEIGISTDTLQNKEEDKNNEKILSGSEPIISETKEEKDNLSVDVQEKVELPEKVIDVSQEITIDLNVNSESIKVEDNDINESVKLEDNEISDLDTDHNKSADDSGFIEDVNKLQNDSNASIIEPNSENNVSKNDEKSESSDLVDTTKEICENTEICDIRSAAFCETSELNEDHVEKSEIKQEVNETLEKPTKDSDINIVKDINESLELSKLNDIQKVVENKLAEEENIVTEESTKVVTEESKKE